jgi:hypothetical protein
MIESDESKRLSVRENALFDDIERQDSDPSFGFPSMLAQTTTSSSYPTAARSYFACVPLTLLGSEQEGGAGLVSTGWSSFLALNLGAKVPPNGTWILTTFVGNRWVFRYDA